jgi:ATP-binding cassette, subfamily B, bacterial HlyB/CyaB
VLNQSNTSQKLIENALAAEPVASLPHPDLTALCLIARLHHIAADPAHLAHQLGWSASHQPTHADLLLAAKHIGLKAKLAPPLLTA